MEIAGEIHDDSRIYGITRIPSEPFNRCPVGLGCLGGDGTLVSLDLGRGAEFNNRPDGPVIAGLPLSWTIPLRAVTGASVTPLAKI